MVFCLFCSEIYWPLADGTAAENSGGEHGGAAAVSSVGTEGGAEHFSIPGADPHCTECTYSG